MALEDEIRQASEQFYAPLNRVINGDLGSMMEVWSHGSDVTTLHPLGGRETGWEEVRASWEQVAQAFSDGQVSIGDLVVVPYPTMWPTHWALNMAKRSSERRR
jgi:hypothetical protein